MSNYFGSLAVHTGQIPVSNPASNDVSTLETLNHMASLARSNAGSSQVRQALGEALQGLDRGSAGRLEIASRVFDFVHSRVSFAADEAVLQEEFGVDPFNELLIEPAVLLSMQEPRGDCDDFSMLTVAMLLGAGLPAYFITIAADDSAPDRWSHVYVGTTLENGEDIALDTSHGKYIGWESPKQFKKQKWPVWAGAQEMLSPEDRAVMKSGFPGMKGLGDWSDVFETGIESASDILKARYSVPQLNPGQYIQTKNGVMYQLNPNQASLQTIPNFATSGGVGTLAIVGIGAVALLMMVNHR